MEYPKINSLYKRRGVTYDKETNTYTYDKSKKHELLMGEYADLAFGLIKEWQVFEKIDGTNIRITFERDLAKEANTRDGKNYFTVTFDGRKKDSSIPSFLYKYLQDTFTVEKMASVFPNTSRVILYGEGYGSKIQSGGKYRDDVSFILFDVFVKDEWWLAYEDRLQIADALQIDHVPYLGKMEEAEIIDYVSMHPKSKIAKDINFPMEGVVCTTNPILRLRNGDPIKFKLLSEDL